MENVLPEIIRVLLVGTIAILLYQQGRKRKLYLQKGWTLILTGLCLVLMGAILDVTDNFERLNKFVVIGDTSVEAFLEKVVGYILGDVLIAIGFWKWLPVVGALRKTERELERSNQQLLEKDKKTSELLQAVNLLQDNFVKNEAPSKLFENLLSALLDLSRSEYGFIGEILEGPDGKPYLKTQSITNIAWNKETREFYEKNTPSGLEFYNLDTLFGYVIKNGELLISNDPSFDNRSGGTPSGHPPLKAFLGVPLYFGEELVGMAGLANRQGGYDKQLVNYLDPLFIQCGNIIGAYRIESKRKKFEKEVLAYSSQQEIAAKLVNLVLLEDSSEAILQEAAGMLSELWHFDKAILLRYSPMKDQLSWTFLSGTWKKSNMENLGPRPLNSFEPYFLSNALRKEGPTVIQEKQLGLPNGNSGILIQEGVKGGVFLPVFVDGLPRWGLGLFSKEEKKFKYEDIIFLETIMKILGESLSKRQSRNALKSISEGTAAVTGEPFFRSLVKNLAESFHVKYAFVSEKLDSTKHQAKVLAMWNGEGFEDSFEYSINGTPCEKVFQGERSVFNDGVGKLFHDDFWLKGRGIRSYVAVPLSNPSGKIIGHLGIMNVRPLVKGMDWDAILPLFASRAAAELEREKFQKALEKSEEDYRDLLENANDLIQSIDETGKLLYVNSKWLDVLGYTKDEISEFSLENFIHPSALDHCQKIFKEMMEGKAIPSLETVFITKSGHAVNVEGNINVRVDRSGRLSTRGIFRDITERRRREQALKERAHHFRLFSMSTGDCFWNWDMIKGEVERSSGFERAFDYAPEEISPGIDWWIDRIHPDDKERVLKVFEVAVEQGHSTCGYEYRFRRRDGFYAVIDDHVCLIRDASGKVIRSLGAMQDITERKKAQEVLNFKQQETSRLKALLEIVMHNMTAGLVVSDHEGRTIMINRVGLEILGVNDQNINGKVLSETYPELKGFEQEESFKKSLNEIVLHRKDGKTVPIGFSSSPFDFGEGGISGVITVFKDLTAQLEEEKRGREKEKLATIGGVAAGIAHEIKNPLFAISSGIQLLQNTLKTEKKGLRTFDIIFQETMRVDRLIKQLLNYSGSRKINRTAVLFPELIGEVLTLNRGLLESKEIQVKRTGSKTSFTAWADRDLLIQVLINLIQNAIEVSPRRGRLTVACETIKRGQFLRIKVQDTGPGVSQEITEKIFDPFYSTKKGNTGMGLAISKRIIIDHGGEIWVENHRKGGAAFIFEIPLTPESEII